MGRDPRVAKWSEVPDGPVAFHFRRYILGRLQTALCSGSTFLARDDSPEEQVTSSGSDTATGSPAVCKVGVGWDMGHAESVPL
jgi:hypothetical protein